MRGTFQAGTCAQEDLHPATLQGVGVQEREDMSKRLSGTAGDSCQSSKEQLSGSPKGCQQASLSSTHY